MAWLDMARKRTKKPSTKKKQDAPVKKTGKVVPATPPSEHQTDELPGWWAAMERAFSAFERAARQAPSSVEQDPAIASPQQVERPEKAAIETTDSTLDTEVLQRPEEPVVEAEGFTDEEPEPATDEEPEPATDEEPEGFTDEEPEPATDEEPEGFTDEETEPLEEPIFQRLDPVEMLIVNTPIDDDAVVPDAPPPIPERRHRPLLPISDPAVEALLDDVHCLFTLGDVNGALISLERVVMLTNENARVDSFLERNEERLLELFEHVFDGFDQNVRTVENPNAIGPDFREHEQVSRVWAAVVERHRLRDVMESLDDSPVRIAAVLHHLLRTRRIQFSD